MPHDEDGLSQQESAALETAETEYDPIFDALFDGRLDDAGERAVVAALKQRNAIAATAALAGQDSALTITARRDGKGGFALQIGLAIAGAGVPEDRPGGGLFEVVAPEA